MCVALRYLHVISTLYIRVKRLTKLKRKQMYLQKQTGKWQHLTTLHSPGAMWLDKYSNASFSNRERFFLYLFYCDLLGITFDRLITKALKHFIFECYRTKYV